MAILAVSASRISPTMITSGSWRTNARKAVAKFNPIAGFTWVWLMPWISYSTGSSIVRILRVVSLRIESMVASVVVLPLPVGPVITIMPCGNASRRRIVVSSRLKRPSFPMSSSPRSRGSRRITADSPCCAGIVATRMSISERATRSRAAPSCGRRRSAMLSPARILMREISACGTAPAGVATARSRPSTRMRTTSPLRNGSMWMSLARSSIAFSRRSLTARTTGAPLARSRRLSMSSSPGARVTSLASGAEASSPRRSVSAVAISSNEATSISTGPPSTISAARMAAASLGSASASRKRRSGV